jgi:hypothetical protein
MSTRTTDRQATGEHPVLEQWPPQVVTERHPPLPRPRRTVEAMEDVTRDLLADELAPGLRRAGLADGWVELSRRGGHLDAQAAELDELRDAIVDGTIEVPRRPSGPVLPTPERG